jgi:NTE family protein
MTAAPARDGEPREAHRGQHHRGRIALVLGAGGPVGHAYHAGVLSALEHALGWDARRVELVVGTSAGAQVAALLRAGMHGEDLRARVLGEPLRPTAHDIARHYLRPCPSSPETERSFVPAAPGYLARSLRMPTLFRPGRLVAAVLPAGRVSLTPLGDGIRRMFDGRWPEAPTWITSVHLDSGEPVAFGTADAPSIDVGTAVACSAAVPGVFRPVEWEGLRYVDGAVASATHVPLVRDQKMDLVIVCSPLSVFPPMSALVRREVRALERGGTAAALLEPVGAAGAAMGYRPMDLLRGPRVAQAAYETTLRAIEQGVLRERFRDAF